jgi:TPR repeat protein
MRAAQNKKAECIVHVMACSELVSCFLYGDGVTHSLTLAAEFMRKCGKHGRPEDQYNLALRLGVRGKGQDVEEAHEWLAAAAERAGSFQSRSSNFWRRVDGHGLGVMRLRYWA